MEIYLIRHAAAADLDNEIVEEGYRYITVHGRNHCRIVAQKLKDLKVKFDAVFSSPLVRAVQTAEVFSSVLKYENEIKTAIELIGGHSYSRFQQLIKRNSHNGSIAFFGHAPDVNLFAHNLVMETHVGFHFNFKNSSVCKIEYSVEYEKGRLVWFLDSENMRLQEG